MHKDLLCGDVTRCGMFTLFYCVRARIQSLKQRFKELVF